MYKISKNRALNILGLEYENFIHKLAEGEGSTMTFAQTSATINNLPVSNVRPKDVLVVKCIQNGVDYVMDLLRKDDLFFDKQTLKMINRYVASNDNFDNIGDFRIWPIKIAGAKHRGSNPNEFDDIFFNISEKYNSDKNYDEIDLFMDLAKTQFFGNGNKRAGQLMMNGLLVSKGYCPFVINFKEPKFSEALVKWYDDNDEKTIYNMMAKKQVEILKDYLTDEELEKFERN